MSLSIEFSDGDKRGKGMESPGACLKRERELRGFSLHDVHAATRIPVKRLADLEADNFNALPQEAFVKGYIKASCKFMGLDETDLLLRYELFMKDNAPLEEVPSEVAAPGPERAVSLGSKKVMGLLLALGLLIIIGFYFLRGSGPEERLVNTPGVAAPSAPVESVEPSVTASAAVPVSEHEAAATPGHVLKIIATDNLWLKLTIDKKKPFDVLLKKGEAKQWLMKSGVSLVIGNAGGATLVFDGKPVKMPHKPGRVIKMKFPLSP